MEARIRRAALLAAVLIVSMGASYRTPNFIIQTRDPQLAEGLGKAAEKYRRELALSWLGKEMPDWSRPCPVKVQAGPHLGAGGATTFLFNRGEVFGWRMSIQGPVERLYDSVLPHEITHMVFASHFRQPLPRWADEGGATTVEHQSERMKHRRMLIQFLKTGRGIAFGRMFAMKEYPRDIMPLYAQGYSLAEYLIYQGGRRKYLDFLADGLEGGRWSDALRTHYGIRDLGTLQNSWLAWVREGSPALEPAAPQASPEAVVLVSGETGKLPRPEPNLIFHVADPRPEKSPPAPMVAIRSQSPDARRPGGSSAKALPPAAAGASPRVLPTSGWHAAGGEAAYPSQSPVVAATHEEPVQTQAAHPQPIQKPRQVILEWGRE
jgi:hypothetical protein